MSAPRMSRVEMMREALAASRTGDSALKGSLVGPNGEKRRKPMDYATAVIADSYKTIDPSFVAHLDSEWDAGAAKAAGTKPVGLLMSNSRGNVYVPIVWLTSVVRFEETKFTPAQAVSLITDDAGERVGDALEKVITAFFDRNQPRP